MNDQTFGNVPIEIESSPTFASELTKGLHHFRATVPNHGGEDPGFLIFDGDDTFTSAEVRVFPRTGADDVVEYAVGSHSFRSGSYR